MMLRALLPGLPQRYAIAGLALGALFPLTDLLIQAFDLDRQGPIRYRLDDPSHWLMLATPLLAGIACYWFGLVKADLIRKLRARDKAARRLMHLSLHDRLTGLPNRMALEQEILHYIGAMGKGRFRPAVLLLDLDRFKHVNDTLGHDAGDELLAQFSQRLSRVLGPLARLFRLGGDEFVVTIAGHPEIADLERACRVIEDAACGTFHLRAGNAITGVSIGIAFVEMSDTAMGDVLKRADLALYAAKEIDGPSHILHNEALAARTVERMQMEQDIANALVEDEFFLEYQPIVHAASGNLQAFEALVRWRHPQFGVLQPDAFLPIAQRAGHIMELGKHVIAKAIAEASNWPDSIGLAVNVTGDEFRDPTLTDFIRDCLENNGLAPERLTIEITEAIFTVDPHTVDDALNRLKVLGVRVALDDFGIGFSSINHLRRFPVDRLKIDRSFTRDMVLGGRELELIEIILRLSRTFDVATTVEGIETADQMEVVRALGAGDVQGFLISRPVPAAEIAGLLQAANSDRPGQFLRMSA